MIALFLLVLPLNALAAKTSTESCEAFSHTGEHHLATSCWGEILQQSPENRHALYQRAVAARTLGHIKQAEEDLNTLLQQTKTPDRISVNAEILLVRLAMSQVQEDYTPLQEALRSAEKLAEQLNLTDLTIISQQLLGDLSLKLRDSATAIQHYQQALTLATQQQAGLLQTSLLLSLMRTDEEALRTNYLIRAVDILQAQTTSTHKSSLAIALAIQARQQDNIRIAFQLLKQTIEHSRKLGHKRLLSHSLGELGQLYEEQGRYDEALKLTWEAIASADHQRDSDLLMQWEWQQGRIEKENGNHQVSLKAHRRAIHHLNKIRPDMPIDYSDGRSSFRDTVEPIYLGLVELLLHKADRVEEGEKRQQLLSEAQQTMEHLKTAEMQDYFKDACAVTPSPLADMGAYLYRTAVLYPIILPDRLELLIQIGDTKYHRQSNAPAGKIRVLTARLSRGLRPRGGMPPFPKHVAKSLYDILIKPLEDLLDQHQIDTLVYLPDGPLRKIPLEALWDGERFLVERFAVVIAPGLTLLDPKPTPRENIVGLLAGLSIPGKVVNKLPKNMQTALIQASAVRSRSLSREVNGLSMREVTFRALPDTQSNNEELVAVKLTDEQRNALLRDALTLPGVNKELQRISEIMPSIILQDEDFNLARFETEVGKSYRIVHIASHGIFSGDPKESFIITHDGLLDMNLLEKLFKSDTFSDQPVEILTLSACQTAEGDERSPLGLSGVAIKSGARSAIGSLWPVADAVAQTLLPDFYANLQKDNTTKAKSLQQAKLTLMKDPKYRHPGFWSPFILIGNWL